MHTPEVISASYPKTTSSIGQAEVLEQQRNAMTAASTAAQATSGASPKYRMKALLNGAGSSVLFWSGENTIIRLY